MIERIMAVVLLKHYAERDPIKSMRAHYPQWLNGWEADLSELIAEILSQYEADNTPAQTMVMLMLSACRQDILLNELWFRVAEEKL